MDAEPTYGAAAMKPKVDNTPSCKVSNLEYRVSQLERTVKMLLDALTDYKGK